MGSSPTLVGFFVYGINVIFSENQIGEKHLGLFDKILFNIIKGRAEKILKMIQDDPILKKNKKDFN